MKLPLLALVTVTSRLIPAYSHGHILYEGMPGEIDMDALLDKYDTDGDFLEGFEYIEPGPDDVRSPCPFLNILANHGFVNRSGKNINVFELAAHSVIFDLEPEPAFTQAANITIPSGRSEVTDEGPMIDLDALWLRPGEERDASMVFKNPGLVGPNIDRVHFFEFPLSDEMMTPGGNDDDNDEIEERSDLAIHANCDGLSPGARSNCEFTQWIDEDLLESMLSRNPGSDVLRFEDLMAAGRERIIHSRINDPFFSLPPFDRGTAQAQYWFPMVMSDSFDLEDGVPKDILRMFWVENRLPEGYKPRIFRDPDFELFDLLNPTNVAGQFTVRMRMMIEQAMAEPLSPPADYENSPAKNVGGLRGKVVDFQSYQEDMIQ